MSKGKKYILQYELYPGYPIWYLCELQYCSNSNSSWALESTQTFKKADAIKFCKSKAERIAKILYEQEDEEGYTHKWEIVEAETKQNE